MKKLKHYILFLILLGWPTFIIGQDTLRLSTQSDTLLMIGTVVEKAFMYQELYQVSQLQKMLLEQDKIKLKEQNIDLLETIAVIAKENDLLKNESTFWTPFFIGAGSVLVVITAILITLNNVK